MDPARETNSANPQVPLVALNASMPPSHGVPMTLAPFILAPEAVSVLPMFNTLHAAPISLLHHLPSNTASLIPDSAVSGIKAGVQSVLDTTPTDIPLEYVVVSLKFASFNQSANTCHFTGSSSLTQALSP